MVLVGTEKVTSSSALEKKQEARWQKKKKEKEGGESARGSELILIPEYASKCKKTWLEEKLLQRVIIFRMQIVSTL